MLFKYSRATIQNKDHNNSVQQNNVSTIMPMHMGSLVNHRPRIHKQIKEPPVVDMQKSAPPVNPVVQPKQMLWGQPTWFLLHCLAEKVKESSFPKIRKSLFKTIIQICGNLPCPECAEHATNHLQRINFDAIQTKEQLKTMLWNFHNIVNKKKHYPIFPFEKLNQYNNAHFKNIVQNFFYHYTKKNYGMRVGAHNFHRGLATKDIQHWFQENMNHFTK